MCGLEGLFHREEEHGKAQDLNAMTENGFQRLVRELQESIENGMTEHAPTKTLSNNVSRDPQALSTTTKQQYKLSYDIGVSNESFFLKIDLRDVPTVRQNNTFQRNRK